MRDLDQVLADLDGWANGREPDDVALPLSAAGPELRDRRRAALSAGLPALRATGVPDEPRAVADGVLDAATTDALAMAALVLGHEFLRLHERGRDGRSALRRVYRAYRLIRPLRVALAALPESDVRSRTADELRRLYGHLKPVIDAARAARAARRGPPRAGSVDEASLEITDDLLPPGEDRPTPPTASAPSPDDDVAALFDEELPEHLARIEPPRHAETIPDLDEPSVADVVAHAVAEVTLPPATTTTRAPAARTPRWKLALLAAVVVALLASAGVLVAHRLMGSAGFAAYEEIAPVSGMIRPADPPDTVIFLLDERWDALSEAERRRAVGELAAAAEAREQLGSVVCRDARGRVVARADGGGVTLSP